MTVEELAGERANQHPFLRYLADVLTLSRFAAAVFIVTLGLFYGPEALTAALIAVLYGWATDWADGSIARSSGGEETWVGRIDRAADLALVYAFFLFLVLTGLYPLIPALIIMGATVIALSLRPTESVRDMVVAPISALPIVLSFCGGWVLGVCFGVFIAACLVVRWERVAAYAGRARGEADSWREAEPGP